MNLMNRFRDKQKVTALLKKIEEIVKPEKDYSIMEICGTHTVAISRWGLRGLLPKNIRLISGPGCPVCVTSQGEIDIIFDLLNKHDVTIAVYGDLMRVPNSNGENLLHLRGKGKKILIINSVVELIRIADKNPEEDFVFVSIGFETTTPQTAFLIKEAEKKGIKNLSVLLFNKTMPEILNLLLADENLAINGFIAPGHVSTVTGVELYQGIIRQNRAAVITGFEPVEILEGVMEIIKQVNTNNFTVGNCYKRVVSGKKNIKAYELMYDVFESFDAVWRGIGLIRNSGLKIRVKYEDFDAMLKYNLKAYSYNERAGCKCGEVLKGYIKPMDCPLFGSFCTYENPYGPCMVSSEGTCAAYYLYGGIDG
ncbi:MAG: hydrogenase formation protein HypD [Calditerrivibrio nitroreducens]|uniref:Hydrogenase formation protein HypD n=1 Tax=Calditerrivibrio nitroreducens TaxID=477976 RepID=A0A2J6WNM6_9BACT|nr:MAG: hydrogenase formation protein HypD [Calditerrivibrio nitroreducens]